MQAMGWDVSSDTISRDLLAAASTVEAQILRYRIPPRAKTCDTGDPRASLFHLENFALCYQLASLLELYRSFPELPAQQAPVVETRTNSVFSPSPSLGSADSSRLYQNQWQGRRRLLLDMASTLIGLLEGVPEDCGLSMGHTIAIIISGSVLYSMPEDIVQEDQCPDVGGLLNSIVTRPTNVEKWRESLRRRVRSNSSVTGLKSFEQVGYLLEAVWSRMDAITEHQSSNTDDPLDVHWLDVMTDCRLETVFG